MRTWQAWWNCSKEKQWLSAVKAQRTIISWKRPALTLWKGFPPWYVAATRLTITRSCSTTKKSTSTVPCLLAESTFPSNRGRDMVSTISSKLVPCLEKTKSSFIFDFLDFFFAWFTAHTWLRYWSSISTHHSTSLASCWVSLCSFLLPAIILSSSQFSETEDASSLLTLILELRPEDEPVLAEALTETQ